MSWYVANCLDVLLDEINASAPHRSKASDGSIGDADHAASTSDHNPCDCHEAVCARDFTHDPSGGFDSYEFAEWLRQRCDDGKETRVKYVISNRKIASATDDWAWRTYTGSNPHDHHVHVSACHPAGSFDDDDPWGWDDVSAQEVWSWDVDPASSGQYSASGAVWTTMSRAGYLANEFAPATTATLVEIAADVDTLEDAVTSQAAQIAGVTTAVVDLQGAVSGQRVALDHLARVVWLVLVLILVLVVAAGVATGAWVAG